MNMSKAPENTGSNYVMFPSVSATGAGFVHSRCYKNFLPSLRLALALVGLEWFRMCHFNSKEWMQAFTAELPSTKETIPPPDIEFSIFSSSVLRYHMSILHCNGLLEFASSLFKTKNGLFQFIYSTRAHNVSLVFFRVIEGTVQ